jgi:uncharacterized protein (DUF952 family)
VAASPAPVDLADGYIHLSAQDQVAGTLAKWFAGQDDLYLAAVDLTALGDTVKWEEARGGAFSRISMAAAALRRGGAWAAAMGR